MFDCPCLPCVSAAWWAASLRLLVDKALLPEVSLSPQPLPSLFFCSIILHHIISYHTTILFILPFLSPVPFIIFPPCTHQIIPRRTKSYHVAPNTAPHRAPGPEASWAALLGESVRVCLGRPPRLLVKAAVLRALLEAGFEEEEGGSALHSGVGNKIGSVCEDK